MGVAFILLLVILMSTTSLINGKPTYVEEVVNPIVLPKGSNCSKPLLSFSSVGTSFPLEAQYTPPTDCNKSWDMVVLEWKASAKGNASTGRIGGVWLSGLQILHTSTPRPTAEGEEWVVHSDISVYKEMLQSPHKLLVVLQSIDGGPEDAVYNVSINAIFFYKDGDVSRSNVKSPLSSRFDPSGLFPPPLFLPIVPSQAANGSGLWFVLNGNETKGATFEVPSKIDGVRLEVFISPVGKERFWYKSETNPFREVVVTLDDKYTVDAIWPFPIIYGGDIDMKYWKSLAGIGAFKLPTYDVILDQFVSVLGDGKPHKLSFSVTNAKESWYVGANMMIFTDDSLVSMEGGLIYNSAFPTQIFRDGNVTIASRTFSNFGFNIIRGNNITTQVNHQLKSYHLNFNGTIQLQMWSKQTLFSNMTHGNFLFWKDVIEFPLKLNTSEVDHSFNHEFSSILNLNGEGFRGGNYTSIFRNHQVAAAGSTLQELSYANSDSEGCYTRSVMVSDESQLSYDNITATC